MSQSKKLDKLYRAMKEADRFRDSCKKAIKHFEQSSSDLYPSKDFASAKRHSMDLSNALSDLRNYKTN